jgi:plastocyanin
MRAARRLAAILALVPALALVAVPSAGAANTRVSIANYAWSQPEVHVNLGEKVIWDWLGPDLAHSVTGVSANALAWDSDPKTDAPYHHAGYSYTI